MKNKNILQNYINNFRRHLTPNLRPDIGLACKVFPVENDGAILEFTLGAVENDDEYAAVSETVNAALINVKQKMVGGNLSGIKFGGTNISMERGRIVLIKGEDDDSLGNDAGAQADVQRLLQGSRRDQL